MNETGNAPRYRGPDIPRPLGERLQTALKLDDRPSTFGDWVDAMAAITDREGIDVDLDVLCTMDESPHKATFREQTQHYQCAQDAFIVPFLAEDVDTVEIETESPVSGERITMTVTESAVEYEPSSAVVSFGVAADVDEPRSDVAGPVLAYELICPYGHAFASRTEYDEWAAATEALTMAISVEDTFELSRALGQVGHP